MLYKAWLVNWTSKYGKHIPEWLLQLSSPNLSDFQVGYRKIDAALIHSDVFEGYGDINDVLSNEDLLNIIDFLFYILENQTNDLKPLILDLLYTMCTYTSHKSLTSKSLVMAAKIKSKICEKIKELDQFSIEDSLLHEALEDLQKVCL